MKKLYFVSLCVFAFIGVANADTIAASIAATSYVQGATATRVSAGEVQSSGPSLGSVVKTVTVAQYNNDVLDKRINYTREYVKIPTGANPASGTPTGETYIWLE